jgi:hypothetical protein
MDIQWYDDVGYCVKFAKRDNYYDIDEVDMDADEDISNVTIYEITYPNSELYKGYIGYFSYMKYDLEDFKVFPHKYITLNTTRFYDNDLGFKNDNQYIKLPTYGTIDDFILKDKNTPSIVHIVGAGEDEIYKVLYLRYNSYPYEYNDEQNANNDIEALANANRLISAIVYNKINNTLSFKWFNPSGCIVYGSFADTECLLTQSQRFVTVNDSTNVFLSALVYNNTEHYNDLITNFSSLNEIIYKDQNGDGLVAKISTTYNGIKTVSTTTSKVHFAAQSNGWYWVYNKEDNLRIWCERSSDNSPLYYNFNTWTHNYF